MRVAVVSGSCSQNSKSRLLATHLADCLAGWDSADLWMCDLAELGAQLGATLGRQHLDGPVRAMVERVETADGVIVVSPVYQGSFGGLFKHFIDLVHPDALYGKPVLLAAVGGTHRHAMMIDLQMRPLFSFFSCALVPSSLYTVETDYLAGHLSDPPLVERAAECVRQFVHLMAAQSYGTAVPAPMWR